MQNFKMVQASTHVPGAVHALGLQGGVEINPLADELGRLVLANEQAHRVGDAVEVALGTQGLDQRWGELHIAAARAVAHGLQVVHAAAAEQTAHLQARRARGHSGGGQGGGQVRPR